MSGLMDKAKSAMSGGDKGGSSGGSSGRSDNIKATDKRTFSPAEVSSTTSLPPSLSSSGLWANTLT